MVPVKKHQREQIHKKSRSFERLLRKEPEIILPEKLFNPMGNSIHPI